MTYDMSIIIQSFDNFFLWEV